MTAGADITWRDASGTFNLRVAGIITRAGRVLVCTVEGSGYWFLPGGRVRLGEPAGLALSRELAEELGHDLPVGHLALVVENIYTAGALEHEIGFYYRLTWPDCLAEDDLTGGAEPDHRFRWVPLGDLGSLRFEPAGLAPILAEPGELPRHVLLDRRAP